jgi:hypothetical protein
MIKNDKNTQIMVFVVNIDSPRRYQVKTGKVKYDAPNPNILAVHAASVASTAIFVPYQNITLAGIPNIIAAWNGLPSHHVQI